jgi:nucleoside-diphosphate-sugar epimerase
VQWIDARDLAAWTIAAIERGLTGPFNLVSPARRDRMTDLLEACRRVADSDAHITWVDGDLLLERGVQPFSDLPFWLPGEASSFMTISSARAQAVGLRAREVAGSVAATLDWHRNRDAPDDLPGRLSAARERELLKAWHAC